MSHGTSLKKKQGLYLGCVTKGIVNTYCDRFYTFKPTWTRSPHCYRLMEISTSAFPSELSKVLWYDGKFQNNQWDYFVNLCVQSQGGTVYCNSYMEHTIAVFTSVKVRDYWVSTIDPKWPVSFCTDEHLMKHIIVFCIMARASVFWTGRSFVICN